MNKIKYVLLSFLVLIVMCFVYFMTYTLAEPKVYDFMVKNVLVEKLPFDNHKQVYGHDDILLVVLDNKTAQRYRWPWKRARFCEIFDYFLNYAHPKALVYDFIIVTDDKEDLASDKKFFNTVNKLKNFIVGFQPVISYWEDSSVGVKYDKKFADKFVINVENNSNKQYQFYESMLTMPDGYFDVVKYTGSVHMWPGFIDGNIEDWSRDEIYRNHEFLFKYNNGVYYPSLALKTFLFVNDNPKLVLDDKYLTFPDLNYKTRYVHSVNPTLPIKYYKLYDSGYSHMSCSAVDIMDSTKLLKAGKSPIIDPEVFKDKIVVIGANVPTGAGLNDVKASPLRINHPGVDYQATAIDNLLHKDFLHIVPTWTNLLITLFGMFLVYMGIKNSGLIKSVLMTIITIFMYILICVICFYNDVVINVITPIVMFVITTIIAYTYKYVVEQHSKEKVKTAMGKYMSQDVMKNVVQNIDNLGLGGKKATVTVLFADIRGFTSMSEKMSAQQVSEFLNEYFTAMEPIITKHNGIINKFIGDAVMAIFGEPIQDENHVENAVKCGYEMLERVEKLRKKWLSEGKPEIEIGVGINTGEVFIGNIGSVNRMEYTVIGDTVNLASRLESYNKVYKTKMLVSSAVYQKIKGIAFVIKIPDVQIRGKANKMDIYEVLRIKLD